MDRIALMPRADNSWWIMSLVKHRFNSFIVIGSTSSENNRSCVFQGATLHQRIRNLLWRDQFLQCNPTLLLTQAQRPALDYCERYDVFGVTKELPRCAGINALHPPISISHFGDHAVAVVVRNQQARLPLLHLLPISNPFLPGSLPSCFLLACTPVYKRQLVAFVRSFVRFNHKF